MPPSLRLSKSRFTAGLQCPKLLWWRVHEPDAPELVPDPRQQAIFDQGTAVGEVARGYVPGGRLVDLPYQAFGDRIAMTRELVEDGSSAIYEGSFMADRVYSAVDILEPDPEAGAGAWRLIEVKSSTRVKEEHYPDIAVQLYVVRRCGIEVSGAELMHLNRACTYPELGDLFVREDVSAEAEEWQERIPGMVAEQLEMLAGALPEVAVGPHCRKPHDCPFMGRCWVDRPEHHVATLYRVKNGGAHLVAQGFETIDQIPAEMQLSPTQARQREAVATGELVVEPGLARALEAFAGPIAFLDFETVAPPIPCWSGCHPYDAIPVQFSCHRLEEDGTVIHHEWIAEGPEDPRGVIARELVEATRGASTVVAYYADFERRCLEMLADAAPDEREELQEIVARLADPLPVVRDHVYHADFGGSFSLKAVLPVLVPELSYEGMEIAEGTVASLELQRLMFAGEAMPAEERARVREALLRYCALDTLGMLRLLERLRELAG